MQGQRQVVRAAAEFYGPDRELFLGPLTGEAVPSYLKGEYPGDYVRPVFMLLADSCSAAGCC